MTPTVEKLAKEIARLDAAQFVEFWRYVTEERLKRGLSIPADDDLVRHEDLALSQQKLTEDWEEMPDDWEAGQCPSSEVT